MFPSPPKVIVLVGPTASGKTELAIEIAEYAASISGSKGAGGRKDFAQSGGSYNSNEDPLTRIKEFILSKVKID